MKKINVIWTCPHCQRRHHWKWPKVDCYESSIFMCCDECGKETRMKMGIIAGDFVEVGE